MAASGSSESTYRTPARYARLASSVLRLRESAASSPRTATTAVAARTGTSMLTPSIAGEPSGAGEHGLEARLERFPGLVERLDHHLGRADDRHEVGVSPPAGHEVPVEVAVDAGPGVPADVHSQVRPRGLVDLVHDLQRDLEEVLQIIQLLVLQGRVVPGMPARNHHEVAIVVGVLVEDGEAPRAAPQDEVLPVRLSPGLLGGEAEDAALLLRRVDELAAPGRPEVVHQGSPAPGDGIRSFGPGAESTSPRRVESACTRDCASSPNIARKNGRSFVGYSMRGSPRMPASFPASRTASGSPPSSSTNLRSFALRPVKTRPSATFRIWSSGSFRDSATAAMNWPCTSSSIAWK